MSSNNAFNRLISLDAFRGLTILGMLMVNNMALDAATPKLLTHAPWNEGVYIADLVFPWFLLIVGVALPYSFGAQQKKGLSWGNFILKALWRTLILILLGCLIDSSLIKEPVFDLGVLQLIGLAYFIAALAIKLPRYWRAGLAGLFLLGHWAAIRFIPIPGIGAGSFTENQNLINYLNQVYLQSLHLKGIISTIPTSAMVLIGSVVGELLRTESYSAKQKLGYLFFTGIALALLGWLWNLDLPFNKSIWSASYIVYTAGLGLIGLGIFYALLDVKLWRAWALPLVVLGANAITAYVLPILVKIHILMEWSLPQPNGAMVSLQQAWLNLCYNTAGRYWGGWLYTFWYILVWWLVLYYMYRKRIFLKI
jgi:predicted acyltransferase